MKEKLEMLNLYLNFFYLQPTFGNIKIFLRHKCLVSNRNLWRSKDICLESTLVL